MKTSSLFGIAASAALLTATPLSLDWSATPMPSVSLDAAHARVGRPLTPVSVAGVARRSARRGYYGASGWAPGLGIGLGAAALAAGAAAASPYYGYSGYNSPYYGDTGYGYPYGGSYAYSGYDPGYGGSYAYSGGPKSFSPNIYGFGYRGGGWRNW